MLQAGERYPSLSEETAHPKYHHLNQHSVNIPLTGLIKVRCSNAADSYDFPFTGLDVT